MNNSKFKKALSHELQKEYDSFYSRGEEHIFSPEFEREMEKLLYPESRKARFFAFLRSNAMLRYSLSACTALVICLGSMAVWTNHISDTVKDEGKMVAPPTTNTTVSLPTDDPAVQSNTAYGNNGETPRGVTTGTSVSVPDSDEAPSNTTHEGAELIGPPKMPVFTKPGSVIADPSAKGNAMPGKPSAVTSVTGSASRTKTTTAVTRVPGSSLVTVPGKTTAGSHTYPRITVTKAYPSKYPTKTVGHDTEPVITVKTTPSRTEPPIVVTAAKTTAPYIPGPELPAAKTTAPSHPEPVVTVPKEPYEPCETQVPIVVTEIVPVSKVVIVTVPTCFEIPVPHQDLAEISVNGVTYKFNEYISRDSFDMYTYDYQEEMTLYSGSLYEDALIHFITDENGDPCYLTVYFSYNNCCAFYIRS